nr:hypothetical protein [uncultured Allomuricauda sp.]
MDKERKQLYQKAEKGLLKAMEGIDEATSAILKLPEYRDYAETVYSFNHMKNELKGFLNQDFDRLAVKRKMNSQG